MVGSVKSGDAPSHLWDLADHALDSSGLPEAPIEVNVHVPQVRRCRRTPVRGHQVRTRTVTGLTCKQSVVAGFVLSSDG